MEDAVRLIANITNPETVFALTLSLRMDIFHGINTSAITQTPQGLAQTAVTQRSSGNFETKCLSGVFRPVSTSRDLKYLPDGCCFFAGYSDGAVTGVASFEMTRTVECK
ncbi:hypothetical protein V5799_026632, partial [Amblyomma americanum]